MRRKLRQIVTLHGTQQEPDHAQITLGAFVATDGMVRACQRAQREQLTQREQAQQRTVPTSVVTNQRNEERQAMNKTYAVQVSNCGTVHECEELSEARYFFEVYKEYSRANYGRAAGESVTLFAYGEPLQEFVGQLERDTA